MSDSTQEPVNNAPTEDGSAPYASLTNPLAPAVSAHAQGAQESLYDATVTRGKELQQRPFIAAGVRNIQRQHLKQRDDHLGATAVLGRWDAASALPKLGA